MMREVIRTAQAVQMKSHRRLPLSHARALVHVHHAAILAVIVTAGAVLHPHPHLTHQHLPPPLHPHHRVPVPAPNPHHDREHDRTAIVMHAAAPSIMIDLTKPRPPILLLHQLYLPSQLTILLQALPSHCSELVLTLGSTASDGGRERVRKSIDDR